MRVLRVVVSCMECGAPMEVAIPYSGQTPSVNYEDLVGVCPDCNRRANNEDEVLDVFDCIGSA